MRIPVLKNKAIATDRMIAIHKVIYRRIVAQHNKAMERRGRCLSHPGTSDRPSVVRGSCTLRYGYGQNDHCQGEQIGNRRTTERP